VIAERDGRRQSCRRDPEGLEGLRLDGDRDGDVERDRGEDADPARRCTGAIGSGPHLQRGSPTLLLATRLRGLRDVMTARALGTLSTFLLGACDTTCIER